MTQAKNKILTALTATSMLILPIFVAAADTQDPKLYRWQGEDGAMIFSSTPPPPGVEATEMEMPQPANVTPSKGVVEPMLQRNKALGREFNQIDAQRDALKQRIAAAEERLTQAQQAAIDGETPIAGERQRTTQGANRLLPAYFERQEMLKNRVEQIKTEIDNLRRELQQL